MRQHIVILATMAICSCSSKQEHKPSSHTEHEGTYYVPSSAPSTTQTNEVQSGGYQLDPMTDKYEDGYEDGQAAAEEDRLAGRPGMQSSGDDDDDDDNYEDGYDDGYEDY